MANIIILSHLHAIIHLSELIMKSFNVIFSLFLFAALFFGFGANAFAQDTEYVDSVVNDVPNPAPAPTKWTLSLGIGEGTSNLSIPILDLNAEIMYSLFSHWRLGVAERIHLDQNWVHDKTINFLETTLLMNEFPILFHDKFEFAPRLGVGYEVYYYGGDYESDSYTHGLFAADFGLSFDWKLSPKSSLGFNIDYTFAISPCDINMLLAVTIDYTFHF